MTQKITPTQTAGTTTNGKGLARNDDTTFRDLTQADITALGFTPGGGDAKFSSAYSVGANSGGNGYQQYNRGYLGSASGKYENLPEGNGPAVHGGVGYYNGYFYYPARNNQFFSELFYKVNQINGEVTTISKPANYQSLLFAYYHYETNSFYLSYNYNSGSSFGLARFDLTTEVFTIIASGAGSAYTFGRINKAGTRIADFATANTLTVRNATTYATLFTHSVPAQAAQSVVSFDWIDDVIVVCTYGTGSNQYKSMVNSTTGSINTVFSGSFLSPNNIVTDMENGYIYVDGKIYDASRTLIGTLVIPTPLDSGRCRNYDGRVVLSVTGGVSAIAYCLSVDGLSIYRKTTVLTISGTMTSHGAIFL